MNAPAMIIVMTALERVDSSNTPYSVRQSSAR